MSVISNLHQTWCQPPGDWSVGELDVHVWLAELDQSASSLLRLEQMLSSDERLRARRFSFERDRRHFILARGLLRTILASYLAVAPARLQFRYSPLGKPSLAVPSSAERLHFNVAHSQGLVLYAVTYGRKVGVDIEYIRPLDDADRIAERFFSPRERAVFYTLPKSLKHQAFFTCWTRKEAYLKARGDGLSQPLDQFAVSLVPGEPAQLLSVEGNPHEHERWFLHDLMPPAGYRATLAVEGHNCQFFFWQWSGDRAEKHGISI